MRKTGRGRATILRWQAQGCHLSDPEDLMAWNLRSIQRGRGNAVRQILRHCRDLGSDLISFALTDYRKITESLRMYEREVELAMRDSGQLISRGDAERGAGAVARWFRLGWRLWLSSCTPDLLPLASDPRAFKAKAEETFAEIMATVVAKARQAKIELPV